MCEVNPSDVRERRRTRQWPSALSFALGVATSSAGLLGCESCSKSSPPAGNADAGAALSPERAQQVLARVGARAITLGDYAAALDRMDPFERLRYQTEDRRQALLDEMINVELLAREAERRGLDQRPETVELIRQYQRDELLRGLRASLPGPADLAAEQVSRYYQDHRSEFFDPELRRAAHIELSDESSGRRVLNAALGSSPDRWRELVLEHAPGSAAAGDKTTARPPLEVPGDLGMLSEKPDPLAPSPVPDPVRKAVFAIAEAGQVYPELVAHGGRFHVVRLVSKLEPRQRLLAEVDSLVRARLVQKLQADAEAALLARLREKTSVRVDETALEQVPPPNPAATAPAASSPAGSGGSPTPP
jgi:peptidyl-prolyl cis-trans isomerase C